MKTHFKIASGIAVLAATAVTHAATTTTTMAVSATVPVACTVSAAALNFGNVTTTDQPAESSMRVNCASGIPYKVALDGGQNKIVVGTNVFRRMRFVNASGVAFFYSYDIYKPAPSNNAEWGDSDSANTYPSGSSFAGTGTGADQTLTFRGLTAQGQTTPGTYSDSVTVTIIF